MERQQVILKLMHHLQEAQSLAGEMTRLIEGKNVPQDFDDEEWDEFITCYQQLLAVGYYLGQLKNNLSDWCPVYQTDTGVSFIQRKRGQGKKRRF